jgi:hypothetical protein
MRSLLHTYRYRGCELDSGQIDDQHGPVLGHTSRRPWKKRVVRSTRGINDWNAPRKVALPWLLYYSCAAKKPPCLNLAYFHILYRNMITLLRTDTPTSNQQVYALVLARLFRLFDREIGHYQYDILIDAELLSQGHRH